ncbi:MAG: hypothetical protein KGI98_14875 [Euryarchaeota archaeon]|nr:hypothetical protein [Euryarchaeota archaeon]MDE1879451.1 hypothetical protein [Euryarchaeota archaeon]
MAPRVRRGLLTTNGAVASKPLPSDEVVSRAMDRLFGPAPQSAWRERLDWARMLGRGNPDFYGRRVLSERGRKACKYVARVAYQATKHGTLPAPGRSRTHFRNVLASIYEELNA